MTRVTFLIDRGEDSESYATRTFLPLLRALADVRRLEAARVLAAATAQLAARIIIDVYFDDDARMNESFASAEGRRVSREIINAAGAGIEMITADVLDVGTD
ncbi:MAG: EthD family reductase [Bacteroidota bacterium]|nr:EthD family reductase [Bacteroidota bacterium]